MVIIMGSGRRRRRGYRPYRYVLRRDGVTLERRRGWWSARSERYPKIIGRSRTEMGAVEALAEAIRRRVISLGKAKVSAR